MQRQPGFAGVTTQFRSNTPQLFLDIDRTKAESLGVSFNDVNQTLSMYLGSLYVNSFNEFGRHWQVTIQADGRFRNQVEDINLFQIRNKWGQMVPLGTLVNVREIGGPVFVTRYNLSTAAAITGNLLPGVSTGEAIAFIDRLAGRTLPLSMKTEWTELMFMQIRAGNTAMYVFALAVVSVFLALAALYESWSLPLAVILVVPLCLLCSVAGVLLYESRCQYFRADRPGGAGRPGVQELDLDRRVRQADAPGRDSRVFEATQEACRLRLRPILMTSFAFIFGVFPLVVADRGRRGDAPVAGDRRVQRHARRDAVRDLSHAGLLLRDPGPRRDEAVLGRHDALARLDPAGGTVGGCDRLSARAAGSGPVAPGPLASVPVRAASPGWRCRGSSAASGRNRRLRTGPRLAPRSGPPGGDPQP